MEHCELLGEVHEKEHSRRKKKRLRGGWSFWAGDHFEGQYPTKQMALEAHKEWKRKQVKEEICSL